MEAQSDSRIRCRVEVQPTQVSTLLEAEDAGALSLPLPQHDTRPRSGDVFWGHVPDLPY